MAYDKLAERFERVCSELGFKIMEEEKMARYVDADKIIPTFTGWVEDVKKEYPDAYACAYIFTMKKIVEMLEKAETADVQPVVHGMWIPTKDDNKKECSNCEIIHLIAQYPHGQINYCPNCGAIMDGES